MVDDDEYPIDDMLLSKNHLKLIRSPDQLYWSPKNIIILSLTKCNLTQSTFKINALKNLITLDLSDNKFTNIELSNPKLIVLDCSHNELTTFPRFNSQIQCLNIINNNISSIPYKKIEDMRLVVFLYADNPFLNKISDKKNLLILESKRQKFLVELYWNQNIVNFFPLEMKPILKNCENKKINYSTLKCVEESIYEEYYMYEFYHKIKYNVIV